VTTTTTQQQQAADPPDPNDPSEPGRDRAPPPLPGKDGRPVRASYQLQLQVQALLTAMSDEQKVELGHSVSDLIVDCEFAGVTCNSSYIFTLFHAIWTHFNSINVSDA